MGMQLRRAVPPAEPPEAHRGREGLPQQEMLKGLGFAPRRLAHCEQPKGAHVSAQYHNNGSRLGPGALFVFCHGMDVTFVYMQSAYLKSKSSIGSSATVLHALSESAAPSSSSYICDTDGRKNTTESYT